MRSLPALLRSPVFLRSRGIPARLGSLLMVLQRSPLVKLLPEARIISSSGFTESLARAAAAVAALGAFDAVSGATAVVQVPAPSQNPTEVNMPGGAFGTFNFTLSGVTGTLTPGTWVINGDLPPGLVHGDLKESRSSFISGVPVAAGSFPVTLTLWEFADQSGRSISGDFTIVVADPPAPVVSVPPAGGNFTEGAFVNLIATQTSGFSFVWARDGVPLTADSAVLVSATSPRSYRIPTSNPGTSWRSGDAFVETGWTSVSGGIGYDRDPSPVNFLPLIATGGDTQSVMSGTTRDTVHIRIPFTLQGNTPISNLKLRVQSDDGFIAWLNGTEVASQNRLASVNWNDPAGALNNDGLAAQFREIDITRSVVALRQGQNLLAIQAMNYDVDGPGDRDFLFNCELIGGVEENSQSRRLIIPAINSNQAGSYTLTVINPTGSVTSDPAVIVLPPQIEAHPASVQINSGQSVTLSVEAIVSPPWTYQWYLGTTGDVSQPVAGATAVSFTTPALTATTSYWVRVSNSAGSVDSNAATVTVNAAMAPTITAGPQPATIDAGTSAQLSVTASGDAPLSYQWYEGPSGNTANPQAGATAATFTTPVLTAPVSYWVRVSNAGGNTDSPVALISIRDPFLTWSATQFTAEELTNPAVSGAAADPDGDGLNNEAEYVFGLPAREEGDVPTPAPGTSSGKFTVTFTARQASGAGYAGRVRHYAVEVTANPGAGPWVEVPGFGDIAGADQLVSCPLDINGLTLFCRLRVWLTP